MNAHDEILRLAGLLSTARTRRFAVVQGVAGPGINGETLENTSDRCAKAHGELAAHVQAMEDSRTKGWALAKSLQKQVDILLPVVDMTAAGNTDPDELQRLAVEAFDALAAHRET